MKNIKRYYSEAFEEVDPEGAARFAAEFAINDRLFGTYTQHSLFEHALWIVQCVCETFSQHLEGLPIASALAATGAVQSYLLEWQADLAETRGPDPEEAAQAGKGLLLVALGHLLPTSVEGVRDQVTTDALVDEDQFWEDVRGMVERADRSDRLLRYRVERDAEGPYYSSRPRRALSTYLLLAQIGTQGVRLFVEVLMPGTLVVVDDDCLIGAPA
jgi:hypothetical protein